MDSPQSSSIQLFHLKLIEMETNPTEEKIDIVDALKDLIDRDRALRKQIDVVFHNRSALMSRFQAIKSLNIRFRKQHKEIGSLLFKHAGKDLDFFDEESFDLDRKKLSGLLTSYQKLRETNDELDQLSSEQIEEQEKLQYEIDTVVLKMFKVITLREEFVNQIEIADERIGKLLKVIGH